MGAKKLILGMGATGLSVANFFQQEQILFDICDANPKSEEIVSKNFAQAQFFLQADLQAQNFNQLDLKNYAEIIASPGIDLNKNPLALRARQLGISIIGDLELFARHLDQKTKLICISGSNGKSTVVTLIGELLRKAGLKVALGGNLGRPALDLLTETDADFFVLELSSFQLETCFSLQPFIGAILNISPDHLDRHLTMENYISAKHKIYQNAQHLIYFRDDEKTYPQFLATPTNDKKEQKEQKSAPVSAEKSEQKLEQNSAQKASLSATQVWSLGTDAPKNRQELGLVKQGQKLFLARGTELLSATDNLALAGKSGILNSQVALIVAAILQLDINPLLQVLHEFQGLAHRCKKVAERKGVVYYDDSKATNVGATLAGVENLQLSHNNILLILGGEGKGQDFSPLRELQKIKSIAIFGKDKHQIQQSLQDKFDSHLCAGLCQSVELLAQKAHKGDAVLLAPACASLDMFKNYQHRGEEFLKCVMQLN